MDITDNRKPIMSKFHCRKGAGRNDFTGTEISLLTGLGTKQLSRCIPIFRRITPTAEKLHPGEETTGIAFNIASMSTVTKLFPKYNVTNEIPK
jgi:hypothetical protein